MKKITHVPNNITHVPNNKNTTKIPKHNNHYPNNINIAHVQSITINSLLHPRCHDVNQKLYPHGRMEGGRSQDYSSSGGGGVGGGGGRRNGNAPLATLHL